jgi:hypothetical protein
MSEPEVARARHSETERLYSVREDDDGLVAVPVPDDGVVHIGEIPPAARDPAIVGRWRHFKGADYEFRGLVSSAEGDLVLYLDANGGIWLRPLAMVGERVTRDGVEAVRFVRLAG